MTKSFNKNDFWKMITLYCSAGSIALLNLIPEDFDHSHQTFGIGIV